MNIPTTLTPERATVLYSQWHSEKQRLWGMDREAFWVKGAGFEGGDQPCSTHAASSCPSPQCAVGKGYLWNSCRLDADWLGMWFRAANRDDWENAPLRSILLELGIMYKHTAWAEEMVAHFQHERISFADLAAVCFAIIKWKRIDSGALTILAFMRVPYSDKVDMMDEENLAKSTIYTLGRSFFKAVSIVGALSLALWVNVQLLEAQSEVRENMNTLANSMTGHWANANGPEGTMAPDGFAEWAASGEEYSYMSRRFTGLTPEEGGAMLRKLYASLDVTALKSEADAEWPGIDEYGYKTNFMAREMYAMASQKLPGVLVEAWAKSNKGMWAQIYGASAVAVGVAVKTLLTGWASMSPKLLSYLADFDRSCHAGGNRRFLDVLAGAKATLPARPAKVPPSVGWEAALANERAMTDRDSVLASMLLSTHFPKVLDKQRATLCTKLIGDCTHVRWAARWSNSIPSTPAGAFVPSLFNWMVASLVIGDERHPSAAEILNDRDEVLVYHNKLRDYVDGPVPALARALIWQHVAVLRSNPAARLVVNAAVSQLHGEAAVTQPWKVWDDLRNSTQK